MKNTIFWIKKVFAQNTSFMQSSGTSEDGIVKELFLNKGGGGAEPKVP